VEIALAIDNRFAADPICGCDMSMHRTTKASYVVSMGFLGPQLQFTFSEMGKDV